MTLLNSKLWPSNPRLNLTTDYTDLRRILWLVGLLMCASVARAQVLGDPVDVSQDFQKFENVYFVGSRVASFDTATGQGMLQWDRYLRNTTLSFNKIDVGFARGKATEFPGTEYDQDPVLPAL